MYNNISSKCYQFHSNKYIQAFRILFLVINFISVFYIVLQLGCTQGPVWGTLTISESKRQKKKIST